MTRIGRLVATVALLLATGLIGGTAPLRSEKARLRVGKPTIWTLEQAHYLLARQRRTNLDLQTKALTQDDLNPNAINSSKLDALKTLFAAEVSFDQVRGAENRDVTTRRREVRGQQAAISERLDTFRDQQLALTKDIGAMQIEAARLDPDTQKQDLSVKTAEIQAKQKELDLLGQRIDEATKLRDSLNANLDKPIDLQSFTPGTPATLPESSVSKAIDKALDTGSARLHASATLDNYIQMQYELIAKQLSLLRDDVGTENRLVFLELPLSVYTTPDAKDVLVQMTWTINSLMRCKRKGDDTPVQEEYKVAYNAACGPRTATIRTEAPKTNAIGQWQANTSELMAAFEATRQATPRPTADRQPPAPGPASKFMPVVTATPENAYVVDLFPRQAALNVNAVHDKVNRLNLSGLFSLIGGFGAKTQFERQHELFENYIQQDIFASGFGKGDTTFGWTFGPLPGSRQVASGVKTTYAALVIPADVQAISLKGAACPFKRTSMPVNAASMADLPAACALSERFDLVLPTRREAFELEEITYTPVAPAQTGTMSIRGEYFSPQIGILVDGSPLKARALGLAQTDLDAALAQASDDHFTGEFEYVNSQQLILRIKGGPDQSGTPRITLITPSNAAEINSLPLRINGQNAHTLADNSANGNGLFRPSVSISTIRLVSIDTKNGQVVLDLAGSGIGAASQVEINGRIGAVLNSDAKLLRVKFEPPTDAKWTISVVYGGNRLSTVTADNPLLLKKTGGEVLLSQPPTGSHPARLLIRLGAQVLDEDADALEVAGATLDEDSVAITPGDATFEVEAPGDVVTAVLRRTIGAFKQVLVWRFERQKGTPARWVVK